MVPDPAWKQGRDEVYDEDPAAMEGFVAPEEEPYTDEDEAAALDAWEREHEQKD